MLSSKTAAVARLTRQLTQLNVSKSLTTTAAASASSTIITGNHGFMATNVNGTTATTTTTATTPASIQRPSFLNTTTHTFATNRKAIDAKNVKRLKIQAKKKKNTNQPAAGTDPSEKESDDSSNQPFLQHQEWVKFQQSITIDGFQTGQVTSAQVLKKSRGGKQARRKREKEMARMEDSMSEDLKMPAIRLSEEETEELLARAYAALPPREGKRGTRNLKRQSRRWKLVRDIRSKYKAQLLEAHYRKMEKRQEKRQRTKEMRELSPELVEKDMNYQGQILTRWAETMYGVTANAAAASAEGSSTEEGDKVNA